MIFLTQDDHVTSRCDLSFRPGAPPPKKIASANKFRGRGRAARSQQLIRIHVDRHDDILVEGQFLEDPA